MQYGAPLSLILREVIRPALQTAAIWCLERDQLVLGTGAEESRYMYVKQIGAGPALGWWQCEPATHADLWQNFIPSRPGLADRLRLLCEGMERPGALVSHPMYAAAICGVHYLRVRAALPAAGDAPAMAAYHKRWYNTAAGASDPARSVVHFQAACEVT